MALTIRPAVLGDLPAITEIFNEAAVATTASYHLEPVTVEDRRAWFGRLRAEGFPVLVLADETGDVVGFATYGPFRTLAGYKYTVEHSVYLAPEHRAAGGGRMLMRVLMDHAVQRGIHVMVGVLDAGNEGSVAFHEKLGFQSGPVLPQVGHKFGAWRDVVFVWRILSDELPADPG